MTNGDQRVAKKKRNEADDNTRLVHIGMHDLCEQGITRNTT